jgi:N-acetylglucosamine kinase-like BadF-type ATPase
MIVIADSGSTKTDWRLLHQGKIFQAESPGLNPYFYSDTELEGQIHKVLSPLLNGQEPQEIHFYGAGLSEPEMQQKLNRALSGNFKTSVMVEIHSDMLAAARAAAGKTPGIVGIMGTGANACYYNGKELANTVAAPGYIFGDEGCGAWLGISLLKGVLRKSWPAPIMEAFEKRYALSNAAILQATYKEERPNTFLAGFVPFILDHIADPALHAMVTEGFRQYIRFYLEPLRQEHNPPLYLVGGIAHAFQNLLLPILRQNDFSLQRILSKPIAGLSLYHQEDGKFH